MSSVIRDEEQRISRDHLAIFIGTEDNCSVDDNGRFSSILSSEPSFSSENEDHVPELASLINDNDGITSYGSNMNENEPSSLLHHRTLSDDSIATVAALSGMVLRAHSVTVGNRGCCVIRHSDPKIGEFRCFAFANASELSYNTYYGVLYSILSIEGCAA